MEQFWTSHLKNGLSFLCFHGLLCSVSFSPPIVFHLKSGSHISWYLCTRSPQNVGVLLNPMPGCPPYLLWQTSEHQKHNNSSQFSYVIAFVPFKWSCCLKFEANPSRSFVCSSWILQVIYDWYTVLGLMMLLLRFHSLPLSSWRRTSYSTFHFYYNSRDIDFIIFARG